MRLGIYRIAAVAIAFGVAAAGCNKSAERARIAPSGTDPVMRGKTVYQSSCTACHNSDPRKPGSLGPDVWGSSRELLEARVAHATYPPGYKPKRSTFIMQPVPNARNDLDALHAYLNSTNP